LQVPFVETRAVVYGSFPEPDAEVAILTRSILQIMIDLASQIEVPAADIAEGRVYRPERTPEQERMFPPRTLPLPELMRSKSTSSSSVARRGSVS
jgi:hypothetical protein